MEKAYDLKELVKLSKDEGLMIAEEGAEALVKVVFSWLEESAKLSKTPYDDMGLVVMPKLKEMVLDQIDKIDGQEN